MIRSVTYQMTGMATNTIAAIKNQLPAMLASHVGTRASTASSVIPNKSASSWPGNRLAENPPETPANDAAIPAMGWRPAAL